MVIPGCKPISIWGLFRHGKRYPSMNFGREMKDALAIRDDIISSYKKGHSSLCAQGYEELLGIGKRFKEALPALLGNLEKDSYTFRPSFGIKLENSAKAFVKGLKSRNVALSDMRKVPYGCAKKPEYVS
ncbi:unnamed protein product [Parnassius apollo]|uniref:(apollo) hypothetical protein n=1 Tax=Parnassius apollo TaxID=110799 RepID=A0A8S3XTJ7_PARAO|nr:unnamed protein product [Parnassius apollo]